ncbi:MAG: elongation factor Ts [Candidatus Azambacteria bacterium]|nr:elongation factor Ts [Candidatus Azambacteria bacterium]
MAIALEKIQRLREKTMAALNDVKKALDEAQGDEEKALFILKKTGKIIADKKSSRETKAGMVTSYMHGEGRIGVLLELRCETDFVAKNEEFKLLAHDIALHIAAMDPRYVKPEEVPVDVLATETKMFEEQTSELNKPAEIVKQIIDGKVKKFYDDVCLLNQPFVKDDSMTVKDRIAEGISKLGENIEVGRFARFAM